MLDINIEYFDTYIKKKENYTIIFTPKKLIKDIIWDLSNSIIPFSNGKRYYVYQELVFNIIDFYENSIYSYICISINNINLTCPSIVISNIKQEDCKHILEITNNIMSNHINKKFSLWN